MPQKLLELSREKVEFAYSNAIEREVETPVVFVLDLSDDDAAWVVGLLTDRSNIDDAIDKSEKHQTVPLLTFAVSYEKAGKIIDKLDPHTKNLIDRMQVPETHFLLIVIAQKSISGSFHPKP